MVALQLRPIAVYEVMRFKGSEYLKDPSENPAPGTDTLQVEHWT